MKTQVFVENLTLAEAVLDVERRTARQVLIRAGRSANGRVYTPEVLQQAAPLFEGVKTYANHPTRAEHRERPERSTRDVTGWLTNVEWQEGALYGTRHFARTQAGQDTWALVEDVVSGRAPASLVGASINAVGRASKQDSGDWLVEAIEHVHSVDDVTTPAAGGGFLPLGESAVGDDLTAALLGQLTFEEWFEANPEFTRRLQNEMKATRQTEAIKAAQAEADSTRQALQEAQDEITSLTDRVAMLSQQVTEARRDLELEKALGQVTLPVTWKASLREQLKAAPTEQWATILDSEKAKAALVVQKPRPAVIGAEARVTEAVSNAPTSADLAPRDGEDVAAWQRRIRKENRQ